MWTGMTACLGAAALAVSTDYGRPMKLFSLKSSSFGLWQTNWANKFWGIWGIFDRTISTHGGTALSMFPIIQPLSLQKN